VASKSGLEKWPQKVPSKGALKRCPQKVPSKRLQDPLVTPRERMTR
jgi:hypothetical protein